MQGKRFSSTRSSKVSSVNRQSGGILGLLFVLILAGSWLLIGMKAFPAYGEYLKIKKVVSKVASESPKSLAEAAASFDRSSAIEDITSIKGTDLIFDNKGGKAVVGFSYSKKIPLVPPVSIALDFEGSSR